MATQFDAVTIERLRSLTPAQALESAKNSVWQAGSASSDDFQDVYTQLVEAGVLSWAQIDELES